MTPEQDGGWDGLVDSVMVDVENVFIPRRRRQLINDATIPKPIYPSMTWSRIDCYHINALLYHNDE